MLVTCDTCGHSYDDTYRWTYCPHAYFQMNTLAVRADGEGKMCHTIAEVDAWLHPQEKGPNDG